MVACPDFRIIGNLAKVGGRAFQRSKGRRARTASCSLWRPYLGAKFTVSCGGWKWTEFGVNQLSSPLPWECLSYKASWLLWSHYWPWYLWIRLFEDSFQLCLFCNSSGARSRVVAVGRVDCVASIILTWLILLRTTNLLLPRRSILKVQHLMVLQKAKAACYHCSRAKVGVNQ